ncbi:hypothetical protein OEZ85_002633 [Tetradesmus obliquus]|uniref:Uncharacterized protein n=1 Tax=Tetradesmus obliquus TaxID=3088 RepID=A0ABY8TY53_TETOB|nr:hypothetical protein OEZ85_002633 [Tetradesmus obliquus]
MALQVMINQQLQETGLVRVLNAACPELVAAIKQQQQQQQPPAEAESLLCTRLLAAAVLHVLRRCILADRPAQILWDPTLALMLLPTVKLSAACMQADTGPLMPAAAAAASGDAIAAAAGDGSTAAAAAAFDDWMQLWQEDSAMGLEPICIADHLSYAIIQDYRWKPEEWPNEPSLVALLSAPELHCSWRCTQQQARSTG